MGRRKDWGRRTFPRPLMVYVTREQEARIKDAAERAEVAELGLRRGVAGWLRRLIVAELSRLEQTP